MLYCCNIWTRLRVNYAALFDPGLSGFIGILPDSTAGLLHFKYVLTLIVVLIMVSALKPVYVRRGCHNPIVARRDPSLPGALLPSPFPSLPFSSNAARYVHPTASHSFIFPQ